VIGEELVLQS